MSPEFPPHWKIARVEDISDRVAMGPFGSSIKVETFVAHGIPVISGQHLQGFKVDDSVGYNFITEEHADRLKKANVQRGDVIFTHAGSIGQAAMVPHDAVYDRYVISQRQFYLRCDPEKALPEYVVAYFKSPQGQHALLANSSQVGVPSIARPVTYLRSIPIPLPPLSEQYSIADVLGALGDKIEQNRRTARSLERLARAVFRAWFVDFEPVKAKAAGATAFPSMPQVVFDALPTRFVDSTIGPVPEGWEVKAIGDIAAQARLSAKPDEIDPATPYIGLEHMPRRSFALSEWEAVSKVTSNKSRFRKGQILFGKLRPYFHKVGVAPVDGVCSTDIVVIEPKSTSLLGVALGLVTSDAFVDHTTACSSGTKMPRTNWRDMARYKVALGPSQIASAHTDLVKPIIDHVIAGTYESHKLSELRDYLLPKLLSGTVRVGDATQVTEEAAP